MSDQDHDHWGGTERRKSQEGFAVNSWSSLVSFMSVCLMAVGGISWGLKLESRIDKYADNQASMRERFLADIATTQAILARGMLPITEVKISAIESRMEKLETEIDQCVRKNKARSGLPIEKPGTATPIAPPLESVHRAPGTGDKPGTISTIWDR